ncbi:MAG: carboxylesterase family protein [Chitinophagaceae bacterium]|nr:carboxylesterase family protein [Chitinophagaceae bacterium]
MKELYCLAFLSLALVTSYAQSAPQVHIANGILEGELDSGDIRIFRGIPFAQPPVGDLRWKEPQPVKNWKGVRKALRFAPRPMQTAQFKDMLFRSGKYSEDCLYLNVWAPNTSTDKKHPVLVYFYGGGLYAGDASEVRYDGASMARKGIVVVTVNYRLGIFGFFAHPRLTDESSHHSSGNYGYLDQQAALRWVQINIGAFGGDTARVTIAGQSAGSMSVSVQMASPLSKGLFNGAIGESGSIVGATPPITLNMAEQMGARFTNALNTSFDALREEPAEQLMEEAARSGFHFSTIIDGYFLPQSPREIFTTGRQAGVPLLAGWNATEVSWNDIIGDNEPTVPNYFSALLKIYGSSAEEAAKNYPATNRDEVLRSATDLATERFLGYSTWKWIDLHARTGGRPVYRYLYAQQQPPWADAKTPARTPPFPIAPHSAEIAYALGNLTLYNIYAWTADDYRTSEIMQGFFVNFIRTGDPNGQGLPAWSAYQPGTPNVMIIDRNAHQEPAKNSNRFLFLDSFYYK